LSARDYISAPVNCQLIYKTFLYFQYQTGIIPSGDTEMKKTGEYMVVFCVGAGAYAALELAFRGFTHWSMLPVGGLCFSGLYHITEVSEESRHIQWIMGAAFITAVEFISGSILNIALGWGVWDYSGRAGNLYGQICPLFSAIWLMLCIPGCAICQILRRGLDRVYKK